MRAADWRDRLTFETRVLERYPDDPDALAGLGIALADQGRFEEAVVRFSRATVLALAVNIDQFFAQVAKKLRVDTAAVDPAHVAPGGAQFPRQYDFVRVI